MFDTVCVCENMCICVLFDLISFMLIFVHNLLSEYFVVSYLIETDREALRAGTEELFLLKRETEVNPT